MKVFQKVWQALGVLLVALVFVACGSSTPSDVVVAYTKSVAEGDVKKAMSYVDLSFAKSEKDEAIMEQKISASVEQGKASMDKRGGLKDVVVLSTQERDEKVIVDIEMQFGDGTSQKSQTRCVKVDGDWKISL